MSPPWDVPDLQHRYFDETRDPMTGGEPWSSISRRWARFEFSSRRQDYERARARRAVRASVGGASCAGGREMAGREEVGRTRRVVERLKSS